MLSKELIKFQLDHIYRSIDNTRDGRQAIKKWALTAWLAILVAFVSKKLLVEINDQLVVLIISVAMFWFYEGLSSVHTLLFEQRARSLEKLLVNQEIEDYEPMSLFVVSGHRYISLKTKLALFYSGCFKLETIFLFYLALMIVGITFILLANVT
jgi:hypothetical protein